MKILLSLPPNVVDCFHDITGLSRDEFFCTCDPVGHRLGSGGGTAWLMQQACGDDQFDDWLPKDKRILVHAGGQSRRLPSYAVSGKILMPVPVLRWERGQRLSQTLMDLQLPLYRQMMAMAPDTIHTMVVSGDVCVRATQPLPTIPDADVVCYGLWLPASTAKNHGVFVSSRTTPTVLKQMLQKPSVKTLNELQKDHYYLTDVGVWLLSNRAVKMLMNRCEGRAYDLYGEFGCSLGTDPTIDDAELRELSVAILPLTGGEFYHFGTSREMISSTLALQNLVSDQRQIMHLDRKPHPNIFVQNAVTEVTFTEENANIWIENSHVPKSWQLSRDNIITGVPRNDWDITLAPGECIDVVPVGDSDYEVRRYRIDDPVDSNAVAERANLHRLFAQRRDFQRENWPALVKNWQHSVFYQLDLADAAAQFRNEQIPLPPPLPADAPLMTRIHDAMFRGDSDRAFGLLREGLMQSSQNAQLSIVNYQLCQDQIVWARSPVRIDIAGGWTDTPPFCLMEGGNVVNLAIELNGQPPLQCYVKPCREPHVVLRSIDLGATEVVETNEQLSDYKKVGSPFSIPKAALTLAGFGSPVAVGCAAAVPQPPSLRSQLEAFGCGIELTLLSAVPAGSGLGTSSILAATVLGALNDFCQLGWDKNEIGYRTLILEQMLTTGGGWQDQFGGVLGGVKLLQTTSGFDQNPSVRWLPDGLYTQPEYQQCHLLYYTGITRTAKKILAEIVRRMFLNEHDQLLLLRQMKQHTMDMYEAIQRQDFRQMGLLVRKTWQQNQLLDSGTNPPEVAALTALVDDLCLGYKLPGAGGGGFLYMVAKDPEAAARIKTVLNENRLARNARFVDMTLSKTGLQISRS
ncbi:MAG: bifunctional fucokinase/L-fucose-1-P-guanylyltransferase [Prevotella sp.]|nr:bifunctional fucokinase/L-fucose-1-P-guanylyltransferase [Prevotella sp.]